MRGLALEGGGAKGSYESGVLKALCKRGIYFDAVVGTSIGSIIAAMYASKKYEELDKVWYGVDTKHIIGINSKIVEDFSNKKFSFKQLREEMPNILKIVKNAGVDTTNIRKFLEKHIDEDKIRKSNIDFGLVTFRLNGFKPIEVFKKDIPNGKMIDYILASSYLPGFKLEKLIDDRYYIDGGVYENCPVKMLVDKGYKEIYAVKAWQKKLKYKPKKDIDLHIISPRENLGSILLFDDKMTKYRMELGYYDALKHLDNLDGDKYYFKYKKKEYYNQLFDNKDYKKIIKKYNKGKIPNDNKEFILKIIEKICKINNIKRFKIYNFPFLLARLKISISGYKHNYYYDFLKAIKVNY